MEPVVLASLEEGTLGDSVQVRSLRNGTITRDHMTHATCKLDLMEPVALASLEEGTSGDSVQVRSLRMETLQDTRYILMELPSIMKRPVKEYNILLGDLKLKYDSLDFIHLSKDFHQFSGLKVGDVVKLAFEANAPFFHQITTEKNGCYTSSVLSPLFSLFSSHLSSKNHDSFNKFSNLIPNLNFASLQTLDSLSTSPSPTTPFCSRFYIAIPRAHRIW
ncbi:hypothetical protein QVD17_30645 [Tagetes erecta]|uniref:Uncharacterized protein n=1 Tax=Tagetes erecta TaxID=13708 RepID=A0AAD8K307_TARER|nr:hypothetical protein QVD17_30645 [Tagetes erecta]